MNDILEMLDGLGDKMIDADGEEYRDVNEWEMAALRASLEAQLRSFNEETSELHQQHADEIEALHRRFNAENAALRDELAQAKMQLSESETLNQTMVCGICGGSRNFVAALKAEALREIATRLAGEAAASPHQARIEDEARAFRREADRIEREHKDAP